MSELPLWPEVLGRLVRGDELSTELAEGALSEILSGSATDAQIAAFALGLRAKGETPAELAALVRTMLRFSERVVCWPSTGRCLERASCSWPGSRTASSRSTTDRTSTRRARAFWRRCPAARW